MEQFPEDLVKKFTPELLSKKEVIQNFKKFIKDVETVGELIENSTKTDKTYHPMFGTISAKKWFRLVEIHMKHHDRQRYRIINGLKNQL